MLHKSKLNGVYILSENKNESVTLESIVAPIQGVGDIPEGDLKNLNPEPIKETISKKETVFIYCGPTNNLISRYTSYKNGYPFHLKEHLEKFPLLKSLFVEPDHFSEFEKNVVEKGTVENIWFAEAKKYFSKVVS
jgi:hypothetical protein